ncbi:LysR family transcriptional regulator [Ochrobactrum sp. WV_118_8]|uniref:LysR family transcriptional regulator n=1 Tax=Brucella/Ochrobactrum group TaxID=2826938 RepID=UPI00124E7A08|nr:MULTISPECIES: LysR family transcriptional regulator [Brucella/Ochrobactrum group]KAB2755664.1 LysR family transcriptional regulator [Brucella anthropi]KAB2773761.1 LysR family transcriptional regulator [Brucella anthropi]MCQ9148247.1 LysR family transcriptional regulator [Ochrobactrum sp. BTU2]MCR8494112.1 LysR family transcriptional regulator [Brucella anthropi]UGQ24557.1 LysR family transcriptional regulator [Brucella anthropi]
MLNLPLRGLQVFEAIGRCGTVTKAARELGVSPGAVSQQIRSLEEAIGVTLLERKGRQIALTTWGRIYHEQISKGFEQLARAGDVLERARNHGVIILSALTSVANRWIGPKIFDWQSQHPEARVRLSGQDIEPQLGVEPADFRITYGKRVLAHEHYVELYRDWVVPVCAPQLLAGGTLQQPADILSLPLLGIDWESDYLPPPNWADWARHIGVDTLHAAPGFSFSLSTGAIGAALSGRGVVLAQISMIGEELAERRLIIPYDLRLRLSESYYLAWDRAALSKPFGARFQRWIIKAAKSQEAISRGS